MRQSPLPPQSEHRALAIAQAVYEAFEDYHARFSEITACAKQRFETRD
ncbi:isocitrate dehydrogenase kinase/phosphatase AceK regulatory subunit [Xanthomonas oryzae]|nr:isocitrate dehydrogenase kinase/phosphatase AceK regulatory subunit [Xanthomonas oryzae]